MKHYPVMLGEVLTALKAQDGETYVDGTFGNGGYSEAILKAADCHVIGLDRDPNVRLRADELTSQYDERFRLIETPFSRMSEVLNEHFVDAVILDIGVSSMQIDQADRGFSFMRSGPLDMRMSQSGPSAKDAVNTMARSDLERIFKIYGEEKRARRAADLIVKARETGFIETTDALADLLESGLGRSGKIHPATRVFQALRIFINDELRELYRGLCAAETILKPGGRLIVVTFHSLEDRIVKQFIRRRSERPSGGSRYQPQEDQLDLLPLSFSVDRRSVVKPGKVELAQNVRSRSAKLRCAVRTEADPFPANDDILPNVPSLDYLERAA